MSTEFEEWMDRTFGSDPDVKWFRIPRELLTDLRAFVTARLEEDPDFDVGSYFGGLMQAIITQIMEEPQ